MDGQGLTAFVDLKRYPIDRPDEPEGRQLLDACRRDLAASGACNLPDFLRPEALAALALEAKALAPHGYRKDTRRNAYFSKDDPSLPADDPRRAFFRIAMSQVAGDLFPQDGLLARLYAMPELTEFIRRALELPRLYRHTDSFQDLNLIVLADGDQHPWHFDQNHFSVTLLLQTASEGGHFEYVPGLRSDTDERLDEVRKVFAGDRTRVVVPDRGAGTLTLFKGVHSLHRVSDTHGPVPRITAILSYNEAPEVRIPDRINAMIYGPRVAEILARRAGAPA